MFIQQYLRAQCLPHTLLNINRCKLNQIKKTHLFKLSNYITVSKSNKNNNYRLYLLRTYCKAGHCSGSGVHNFFIKSQLVNILDFAGHIVSVANSVNYAINKLAWQCFNKALFTNMGHRSMPRISYIMSHLKCFKTLKVSTNIITIL